MPVVHSVSKLLLMVVSLISGLRTTAPVSALTKFQMPAMSPTMTEGGIAGWKKQEGDTFTAGDVLVEIETDKATIDVEAQDDGVMAKIIVSERWSATTRPSGLSLYC